MSLVRDPVVAEAFFAQLPATDLSPAEASLLRALLALGEAAIALGLPAGVSLQEWAERRVPNHCVGQVNATGLVFIPGAAKATPPPMSLAREAGNSGRRDLGPSGAVEAVKATVVRSIVAGVKSIGATMLGPLGAMLRLKKAEEPERMEAVENTFYYDTVQKRWRQHGVEDVDVSQIDPKTGRQKAPDLSAHLPPPPMNGPTSGSLNRAGLQAVGSLYVDPLAKATAAWSDTTPTAPTTPSTAMAPAPAACADMLQYRSPMDEDWQSSGQVAGNVPFPTPCTAFPDGSFPSNEELHDGRLLDPPKGRRCILQSVYGELGIIPVPGYEGHKNHGIHLTTGEVGCFMSHFTIWHHMVKHQIPAALILEDDFDLQPDFALKLGEYLEEARGYDWNLLYVGRSPTEPDWTRLSQHVVEPGYTLWTVGYIMRLDGAKALLDAGVERAFAPLDDYFSVAAGRGFDCFYNDKVLEWKPYIPVLLRPMALTPPLVMPYVGSMFLSDTAKVRAATRYVEDLPVSVPDE
ncbi:unnamed protein product [Symbiodinium sp. CCMP2592]|nr:unnamed protein product [Symbiodinium sp. CCMP2592]